MAMPAICRALTRSRKSAAPVATISTGTSEFITETLSALVYCKPTYCSAVNSAPPVTPSQSMIFQCARITGQSRLIWRCANTHNTNAGISQRNVETAIGGTWPPMARPTI